MSAPVTNSTGSVLDPAYTLLAALNPEDTVSAYTHKMKELGLTAGASKPAAAKKRTHAEATTTDGDDDSSDSDFSDDSDDGEDDDFVQPVPGANKVPEAPMRKKPKKEKKIRDPNMPKRPSNHFMIYMEENRAKLVSEGFKGKHVMTEASNRWKALPDAEKAPYTSKAAELKAAYDVAMSTYFKVLRKIIKNSKSTPAAQLLDKVLADYNTEKVESNPKGWLQGKLRGEKMSAWLSNSLGKGEISVEQQNALKGL